MDSARPKKGYPGSTLLDLEVGMVSGGIAQVFDG